MRNLVFLFIFDFIWIKANINSPRQGLLSSFTFYVKCLDCAINTLIHTFSGGALVSWRLRPLVCVKWRVFSKQQLILTKCNRPGNLKGVADFKKQAELYPYKCRSKSLTSSTFTFNRLSKSNVKALFVLTTRKAPVNSISWLFRWPISNKKTISTYHC